MNWTIKISKKAAKSAKKLDKPIREQINRKVREIASLDNPRSQGKALTGNYAGFWRYRVGDYRLICAIEDGELIILVIDINHRSRIYE